MHSVVLPIDAAIREFESASRRDRQWPTRKREAEAMRVLLLDVFLRRAVKISRKGNSVSVQFDTELEAEEYQKVVLKTKRMERV